MRVSSRGAIACGWCTRKGKGVCTPWSVGQRVQNYVDADRVAVRREVIEVVAVLAFALERVAEVGVVRDEDDHVPLLVEDGARVRRRAERAALRGAAAEPEADRGDLREVFDVVERVKERVVERQVDDRIDR